MLEEIRPGQLQDHIDAEAGFIANGKATGPEHAIHDLKFFPQCAA